MYKSNTQFEAYQKTMSSAILASLAYKIGYLAVLKEGTLQDWHLAWESSFSCSKFHTSVREGLKNEGCTLIYFHFAITLFLESQYWPKNVADQNIAKSCINVLLARANFILVFCQWNHSNWMKGRKDYRYDSIIFDMNYLLALNKTLLSLLIFHLAKVCRYHLIKNHFKNKEISPNFVVISSGSINDQGSENRKSLRSIDFGVFWFE